MVIREQLSTYKFYPNFFFEQSSGVVAQNDLAAILQKDAVYNAVGLAAFDLYDEVIFIKYLLQYSECPKSEHVWFSDDQLLFQFTPLFQTERPKTELFLLA